MTVLAGHTIWLRSGTYVGDYIASLAGSNPDHITIRAYPGETPVINGSVGIQGAWVTFRNVRFTNSRTDRTRGAGGNLDTVSSVGANTRLINCVVDNSEENGIGWWALAANSLIYGCVIINNGFVNTADGLGDGHGIYTQNITGVKTFKHNIIGPSFNFCFQAYARTDTPQLGFDFLTNVVLGGRLYFGGDSSVRYQDVFIDSNHINGVMQLGDLHTQNGDVVFTNNRLCGGAVGLSGQPLTFKYWENITCTGNKITSLNNNLLRFIEPADIGSNVRNWDSNEYYGLSLDAAPFNEDGTGDYSLADWRTAKGFDASSTLTAAHPTTNEVFTYANEYQDYFDPREGIVVIWNWEGLASVNVTLTDFGLINGNVYRLKNGLNLSEYQEFTFSGSALSVNMTGWTVAIPTGQVTALMSWTDKPAAFALEKA